MPLLGRAPATIDTVEKAAITSLKHGAVVVAFFVSRSSVSLESFADLTYPGGKKPQRQASRPAPKKDEPNWDDKPVRKVIRGVEMELFPIGALAMALGRAAVTIRLWEREGVIPPASYRLAPKNGIGGRRYYSRAQIEGIRQIAAEEGVLVKGAALTKDFSMRCKQLFVELKKGTTA